MALSEPTQSFGSSSPDLSAAEESQTTRTTLFSTIQEEEVEEEEVCAMEPNSGNVVLTISSKAGLQNDEQNGRGAVAQGAKRFGVREDEHLDFRHQDEEDGDGWERRERARWVAKSINGQTDLWAPPPDRESKLEVVRSGSRYDVRAYKGERKPSRLYDEEEDEGRYRIPREGLSPEKARELEAERQEIIKSQAVRKSTTVAEQWSARDGRAGEAALLGQEPAQTGPSYSTGFALCFDSHSPGQGSTTPVDPQNIDTEQISFAAARQQFLALEKRNPDILLGSRRQAVSPSRAQVMPWSVSGRGEGQTSVILKETDHAGAYDQRGWGGPSEKSNLPTPPRHGSISGDQVRLVQNSAAENLASGGSGETHLALKVIIVDERVSQKHTGNPLGSVAGGPCPAEGPEAEKETPIEREIRLSLAREEDLYRQRGIQRANGRDELVEIRAKPLLSASVSSPASSAKGKDKPRVSFPVQREIVQETKREEDLQKEGRLLGTYSRGDGQQLAQRRKVFERQEEVGLLLPCKPKKPAEAILAPSNLVLYVDDGEGIPFQDVKRSFEAQRTSSARDSRERNPRGELLFSQSSATSNGRMDPPGPESPRIPDSEDPGEKLVIRKKHFAVPVRKLRFSLPGDPEPSTARGEERGPRRAAPRGDVYTLKTWRPRTSALIDQEIQEELERELELQEERRRARLTTEKGPSSPLPPQSSAATDAVGSPPVSSLTTLTPSSPGRWSASPSPDGLLSRRLSSESGFQTCLSPSTRRREEGKYAGIELSDEIDTEVVRSTKAICRRGVLAQLWETGQIRKTHSDDENDNRD